MGSGSQSIEDQQLSSAEAEEQAWQRHRRGPVGAHDLAGPKRLDARRLVRARVRRHRLPTLTATLELASTLDLGLVVEIEERRRVDETLARLREVHECAQALEDIVLLSFDHSSMLRVKECIPRVRREIITHARHVDILAVARAACADSSSVELDMLPADNALALAGAGIGIRCHLPPSSWSERQEAYGLDPAGEFVRAHSDTGRSPRCRVRM